MRTYQGRVRAFFAARVRDAGAADDLAQDTFFLAFRHLASYDASRPFYPWLKAIALNVLRNDSRKHRLLTVKDPERTEEGLDLAAAAYADGLDEAARAGGVLSALRDCVGHLGEAAARVVDARYARGMNLGEIAAGEGTTARTLAVQLVRIRRKLRACVEGRVGMAPAEGGRP